MSPRSSFRTKIVRRYHGGPIGPFLVRQKPRNPDFLQENHGLVLYQFGGEGEILTLINSGVRSVRFTALAMNAIGRLC